MKFLNFEGLQCLLENLLNRIGTKIIVPPNTKVGQYLSVKAIDEEGNPTEWECVDSPIGVPSFNVDNKGQVLSVNADGEQAWVTPSVKHAPYYDTLESGISGLFYKVNMEELEKLTIYAVPDEIKEKTPSVYLIILCDDGSEKPITMVSKNNLFYINNSGNLIYLTIVDSNFTYTIDIADKSTKNNVIVTTSYNTKYLGINNTREYVPANNYNPATKKYVDDSIQNLEIIHPIQSDWNQYDETKLDYVKNKPFYEFSQKGEVIFPYQQIVLGTGGVYEFNPPLSLEEGEECVVEINLIPLTIKYGQEMILIGTEYENTIGNFLYLGADEGLVIVSPVNTRIYLQIYKMGTGVKPLDEKYIPDTILRAEEFHTHTKQVLYYEIESTLEIPEITLNDDGEGNVVTEITGIEVKNDTEGNISILSDKLSVSDGGLGNITINL